MQHIPEDELHAYLDQALSRSQCVEIESHLADCRRCSALRDDIAALRDRTTSLLRELAPVRVHQPGFDLIRARHAEKVARRTSWLSIGAWAASVVVASALGWTAHQLRDATRERAPVAATRPPEPTRDSGRGGTVPVALAARPGPVAPVDSSAAKSEQRRGVAHRSREAAAPESTRPSAPRAARVEADSAAVAIVAPPVESAAVELTSLDTVGSARDAGLEGIWRTVPIEGAEHQTGSPIPYVEGLPVLQVQLQNCNCNENPLVAVDQQLATGEMIRTIEGPLDEVSDIISKQSETPRPENSARQEEIQRRNGEAIMAVRRGNRMLAITGRLSSDSLKALIKLMRARGEQEAEKK